MPHLKAFKVWGVEAELKETIDRAEEILGKLRRLSLISAKASYMSSAWSNRMGSPSAKDKQTILDEVDQQLADLKVSKTERDAITEPSSKSSALTCTRSSQGSFKLTRRPNIVRS